MGENPFVAPETQESQDMAAVPLQMPGLGRGGYGIIAGSLLFMLLLLPAVVVDTASTLIATTFVASLLLLAWLQLF
jgi:hypothetical protein